MIHHVKRKTRIVSVSSIVAVLMCIVWGAGITAAAKDFGQWVEDQLTDHSEQLFGIEKPLQTSALGPYNGADSTKAVEVADHLKVTLVSSAVNASADMIALWPNDDHPTHLFVCDESTSNPAVQRVDSSKPPSSNASTVLIGLSSCDPIRRTAWGTIVAGEESTTGGFYEILSPQTVSSVVVLNRATGATSDPAHVVKRKAVGQLAFEGQAILPDGTMYFGDELRPGGGNPGGAIYKFVPAFPFAGGPPITLTTQSPFDSGQLYGLRVGSAGDNGQGTEIGQGAWVAINPAMFIDVNGNIPLRSYQTALKFTGYYRPEDMDQDPIAAEHDEVRVCWTNTGRMSNAGGSTVETGSIYGEVMCLNDVPAPAASSAAVPTVRRFIAGDSQANYFDNVAFQPHTGNLIVLEDGEVEVTKADGSTELRGNDIWFCLRDGNDRDVQSDGCIRIMSLKDTSSEPTGFIFTGSGETAYVNLQHRQAGSGALLKITGFKIPHHNDDDHDDDNDDGDHDGH